MNNIYTKSFLDKINQKDGIRICVMRRFKPEYKFDMWLPKLAPTEKLLIDYVKKKKISWIEFSVKYKKQILQKQQKYIKLIIYLSKISSVTLLCWEKSPKQCHRMLIWEECMKYKKLN